MHWITGCPISNRHPVIECHSHWITGKLDNGFLHIHITHTHRIGGNKHVASRNSPTTTDRAAAPKRSITCWSNVIRPDTCQSQRVHYLPHLRAITRFIQPTRPLDLCRLTDDVRRSLFRRGCDMAAAVVWRLVRLFVCVYIVNSLRFYCTSVGSVGVKLESNNLQSKFVKICWWRHNYEFYFCDLCRTLHALWRIKL